MIRKAVQDLQAYEPGEQPDNPRVVKLNTNENPYPPSPEVSRALRQWEAGALRRYPDPACAALRKELGSLHGCDPDRILVGNGSDEILALCTRAFVEDNQAIGCFDPTYSLYPVLAAIRGVDVLSTALGAECAWTQPRTDGCGLFLLANPHAPTGCLFGSEAVESLSVAFGGVVVVDEAYVDFASANCVSLALRRRNVLVTRSLSKSYGLAGLRVGYAVGSRELIGALHKVKDSYNVSGIAQHLALVAVRDQAYLRNTVARIVRTRRRLREKLEAMRHKVYASEANFLWVVPRGMGARELFERLRATGILVRYFPGERTGNGVRITVGTDADIDRLLQAMRRLTEGGCA